MAAGATIEQRDGWNVATAFPDEERSLAAVGFADVLAHRQARDPGRLSAITGHELELGRATRADGAWWCPYSAERAVVLCSPADTAAHRDRLAASAADANGLASVIDTTTSQGAMTIVGPLARETFARFTAIDLRPQVTPVLALPARLGGPHRRRDPLRGARPLR